MNPELVSLISLVIGVVSFAASIVFFTAGLKTEKRNRDTLDKIDTAIKGWQGRVMDATLEAMESKPEIIGKRTHLEEAQAKREFIAKLSDSVGKIIENPVSGEARATQVEQLQAILNCFTEISKPNDPFASLQMPQNIVNNPSDTKGKPDESSN